MLFTEIVSSIQPLISVNLMIIWMKGFNITSTVLYNSNMFYGSKTGVFNSELLTHSKSPLVC